MKPVLFWTSLDRVILESGDSSCWILTFLSFFLLSYEYVYFKYDWVINIWSTDLLFPLVVSSPCIISESHFTPLYVGRAFSLQLRRRLQFIGSACCQHRENRYPGSQGVMVVLLLQIIIEFLDTIFFVLQGGKKITFLHVCLHASMFNIWWHVLNWIPWGQSSFDSPWTVLSTSYVLLLWTVCVSIETQVSFVEEISHTGLAGAVCAHQHYPHL